ncbi:MAG: tetratricopeptide repeat protein, partial [Caldilineae bacterium]
MVLLMVPEYEFGWQGRMIMTLHVCDVIAIPPTKSPLVAKGGEINDEEVQGVLCPGVPDHQYRRRGAAPVLEEIGDRATLATVYNNIGGIHYARGEYDAALEWLQ